MNASAQSRATFSEHWQINVLGDSGELSVGKMVEDLSRDRMGTGEHHWNPDSRETADHSIPYVVAASLIDKRLTPSSFSDARLWSPELRALLPRIEVVTNDEFTAAYERLPVEHRTRVTVTLKDGKRTVGEAGGDKGDLSQHKTDAEIENKFRALAEGVLGAKRIDAVLDALWKLDSVEDVSRIPPMLVFAPIPFADNAS